MIDKNKILKNILFELNVYLFYNKCVNTYYV